MRYSPISTTVPMSRAVVLALDGEELLALNYNLGSFSDPVWRDGECDWESEIECWDDIEPFEEVLIAVEPVPPERYQVFIERGHVAFKPTAPPTASFELTVMADTIGKFVEDEITPADADVVVSALAALRSRSDLNASGNPALNRQNLPDAASDFSKSSA
jgi:hypothetical protein